jgi:hypothetical protein
MPHQWRKWVVIYEGTPVAVYSDRSTAIAEAYDGETVMEVDITEVITTDKTQTTLDLGG